MKKYQKLFLILLPLIALDFITTYFGVYVNGLYEMNPITRPLLESGEIYAFGLFVLVLTPFTLYGLISAFPENAGKYPVRKIMTITYIIIYSFVMVNNIYNLVLL